MFIFLNTCFCFAVVLFLNYEMRRLGAITLTSLLGIFIALTLGIPGPFIAYVPFLHYSPAEGVLWLSSASIAIFLLTACVFSRFLNRSHIHTQQARNAFRVVEPLLILTYFLGFIAFLKFLLVGDAFSHFGSAMSSGISGAAEYYAIRADISRLYKVAGQGAWGARIAMAFVFPLIVAISAQLALHTKKRSWWAVFATSSAAAISIALIFGHKFMVFYTVLYPLLVLAVARDPSFEGKIVYSSKKIRYFVSFFMVGLLFLALLFQRTTKLAFEESLQNAVRRAVFTPAIVHMYYIDAFSNTYPKQGMQFLFSLESRSVSDYAGITTEDISSLIASVSENANTDFLAIAFSAMGLIGVLIVSAIVSGLVFFTDRFMLPFSNPVRHVFLLVNILGLISLMGGGVLYTIKSTGFVTGPFIASVLFPAPRREMLRNLMLAIIAIGFILFA